MPIGFSGGSGNGLTIITGTTNGGVDRNSFTAMGRFFFSTDPNTYQRLFSMLDSSTSYLLLETGSAGDNLRLSINGTVTTAHTIVCDSRWYDVAIKVAGEGTNQCEFLIGEATAASLTKYTMTRTGAWVADDMYFGRGNSSDIENPNGAMENWLIYDRVLSDAELEIQRRMRRPIITNGLWGWWPMLGGTIAECLRDLSGNDRTLTQGGTNAVVDASWMPWGGSIIVPQAGAASNAPVLSLPGVQSVTATTAVPKVTLAFA